MCDKTAKRAYTWTISNGQKTLVVVADNMGEAIAIAGNAEAGFTAISCNRNAIVYM